MKKKIIIGIAVFLVAIIALLTWFRSNTKSHSPATKATYSANGLSLEVNYCQPSKKGRLIFGEETAMALQPYGKYWRAGANEATTFETNKDIVFGGKPLKAGKYQLYAIPGKDTWQIGVNTDWDRWGYSEADPAKDVLRIEVPADNSAPLQELFVITFDTADSSNATHLVLHWDQTRVKVPVVVQ